MTCCFVVKFTKMAFSKNRKISLLAVNQALRPCFMIFATQEPV